MNTFREFAKLKENNYMGKNLEGGFHQSYYKPDTMDKMAMMNPQQLAQFAHQRFVKMGGPDADQLPEEWWQKTFGNNVFELLKRNGIAIFNKNTMRYVWNPQFAI